LFVATVLAPACNRPANLPPERPASPVGPDSTAAGDSCVFRASTIEPDGDSLRYEFDWGDGRLSAWIPAASGESARADVVWFSAGKFGVRARARDEHDALSGWSPACTLRVSAVGGFPSVVVDSAEVPGAVTALAMSPQQDFLYAADDCGVLSKFNAQSLELVETHDFGWTVLAGLAVSPGGETLYVGIQDEDEQRVAAVAAATLDPLVEVALPNEYDMPSDLALSPDGQALYVGTESGDDVYVIRTEDFTLSATIPVGASPRHLTISADGKYLYVSLQYDETVAAIRTADNKVVSDEWLNSELGGLAVSADGTRLYVSEADNYAVAVLSVPDMDVVTRIAGFYCPFAMAMTPDGEYLYVVDWEETFMTVASTAANQTVSCIGLDGAWEYTPFAFTSDGRRAFVGDYDGWVYAFERPQGGLK